LETAFSKKIPATKSFAFQTRLQIGKSTALQAASKAWRVQNNVMCENSDHNQDDTHEVGKYVHRPSNQTSSYGERTGLAIEDKGIFVFKRSGLNSK